MKTNPFLLLTAAAALTLSAQAADEPWTELFNGRDLTGWVQRGGRAAYAVEGDAIVGTAVPNTPNSFLCTEKDYGDFVLEYEYKIDPRLNSGLQFRSACTNTPTQIPREGKAISIPANRVHGYQAEIDNDPARNRWWSAGVYDEGGRGWLYPGPAGGDGKAFTGQGRRLSRTNDWNQVRIEARGDAIRTWLNGEPRADLRDGLMPRGFIALQVHGVGGDKSGAQVRWRKLRIRELGAEAAGEPNANALSAEEAQAGWRLLWDGRTTNGWRSAKGATFPARGWEIADGALTVAAGAGAESAAGGDIITCERFADFELALEFRITPGANSGIKYFVQPNLDPVTGAGAKAAAGSAIGLEFQILDDLRHPDAKAGRDGNRTVSSLYDLIPAAAGKPTREPGTWNSARILSKGQHVEHWLNGAKVLEYERGSPDFRERVKQSKYRNIAGFGEWADGHILLQDHGNRVSFRSIKIRAPAEKK